MTLQIQYELSLADYVAAQKLHSTRSFWPLMMNSLVCYIYPILGVLSLFFGIEIFMERNSHHPVTMIVCGTVLVCLPIYTRMRLRSCYKRSRSDSGESTLTFGEARIEMKGQYTNGEMDWNAVKSFREDDKIIMLYLAPARFIAIPKRVCSKEQIDEIRSLSLQQIKPATK